MTDDFSNIFPLSTTKVVKGSRRIAREKVLQMLYAYRSSGEETNLLFEHIHNRSFNFGDEEELLQPSKILKPAEVIEIEADVPIVWMKSDLIFLKKLFEKSLLCGDISDNIIKEIVSNWEIDRISPVEKIMIQIAYAEFVYFADVPPKVTINESIEIVKAYSTDKSGLFINGLLDTILNRLKNEGLINKTGRGLKDK
ncbi:MAG: transcription antitermination factor NusB [Candidatus Kapaibacterium sp.]